MNKMKQMFKLLLTVSIFWIYLFSHSVLADRLVFVQGYIEESSNWATSGVVQQLESHQWHKGGAYYYTKQGLGQKASQYQSAPNQYFTVELPTEASLREQAFYLTAYLKHLRSVSPYERLILVGHSAGGVLSRLVMVQNPSLNVSMLITIASPHLGSDLAELANLVGSTPLALFTPFIGAETLNRSQGLYADLLPEQPGRFLYELNRQPHPKAQYISIVRNPNAEDGGDLVVPAYSQDMRQVFVLKNKARSYIVNGGHSLNSDDGLLIFDLITRYHQERT